MLGSIFSLFYVNVRHVSLVGPNSLQQNYFKNVISSYKIEHVSIVHRLMLYFIDFALHLILSIIYTTFKSFNPRNIAIS